MANPEHLAILKQGVEVWNRWREENPQVQPDLDRANLIGANLSSADFSFARLFGAKMERADLSSAEFYRAVLGNAHLTAANLTEAYLGAADLGGVYLREASLVKTNLKGAYLGRAVLSKADLREIKLAETTFGDTDLKDVHDLESCIFTAPCTIDLRTIALSWPLPDSFLRGCGLSRTFIEYIPSLIGEPFQFCSVFISHSSADGDIAKRLHADLQDNEVRCWFAPHDVKGGEKLHEQIDQAIRVHDRLLLIVSEHSMESEWVKTEIANARQREINEGRRVLFPISLLDFEEVKRWKCFDADTGKDTAREIREYFIPDFSDWKNHDSYKKAFERLLRDLKAPSD